jgi:hypothetical protein
LYCEFRLFYRNQLLLLLLHFYYYHCCYIIAVIVVFFMCMGLCGVFIPWRLCGAVVSGVNLCLLFVKVKVKVKFRVTVQPTISRLRLGVGRPYGTRDQFLFLFEIFF